MAYSINPYRGCEFGCKYCYARYTHEFLQPVKGQRDGPRLSEVRSSPGRWLSSARFT